MKKKHTEKKIRFKFCHGLNWIRLRVRKQKTKKNPANKPKCVCVCAVVLGVLQMITIILNAFNNQVVSWKRMVWALYLCEKCTN